MWVQTYASHYQVWCYFSTPRPIHFSICRIEPAPTLKRKAKERWSREAGWRGERGGSRSKTGQTSARQYECGDSEGTRDFHRAVSEQVVWTEAGRRVEEWNPRMALLWSRWWWRVGESTQLWGRHSQPPWELGTFTGGRAACRARGGHLWTLISKKHPQCGPEPLRLWEVIGAWWVDGPFWVQAGFPGF